MRTRSKARRLRQQQQQQQVLPHLVETPKDTMADNRTMAELLQAPTEGYEDAIVVPEIEAANFEIKHGLLTLVQNKQFFGHDKEDPHAHIRYFNKITSTLRYPNVPTTSIKLMLFPFSLEGAARIWLEKEPPRSIQTWDDLYERFHLRVSPDVAELKDMVRALLLDKQNISVPAPAPVKRVSKVVLHAVVPLYRNCPATDSNNYLDNIQEIRPQAAATNSNKEIRLPVRHQWQTISDHPVFLPCNTTAKPIIRIVRTRIKTKTVEMATTRVKSNDPRFGFSPSNHLLTRRSELKSTLTEAMFPYDGLKFTSVVEVEHEVTKAGAS
ncbi:hypothetical protein Tco_0159032 [Tanacetum coccineum]